MNARRLQRVAMASLVGLMLVSLLLAVVPAAGSGHLPRGMPPGLMLALVKVLALGFLFVRVRDVNVYSLQWSSMFILLLVAEGVVRATTDPPDTAALGIVEAVFALVYFVAVLAILRPIKRRAQAQARDVSADGSVERTNDDRAADRSCHPSGTGTADGVGGSTNR